MTNTTTTITTTNGVEFEVQAQVINISATEEIVLDTKIKNGLISFKFVSVIKSKKTLINATATADKPIEELAKAFTELMNIFDDMFISSNPEE